MHLLYRAGAMCQAVQSLLCTTLLAVQMSVRGVQADASGPLPAGTISQAVQPAVHDLTDNSVARSWLNNPLSGSLATDIYKATNIVRSFAQASCPSLCLLSVCCLILLGVCCGHAVWWCCAVLCCSVLRLGRSSRPLAARLTHAALFSQAAVVIF